MPDPIIVRRLLILTLALLAGASVLIPAAAQDRRPAWAFVQGGSSAHSVDHLGVGLTWPLAWKRQAWRGEFSAQAELSLSYWRARAFGGGGQGFVNVGLVPMLRYRFDQGNSPWFVEGGIGLTASSKRYVTPDKTFSTRLNFSDNLAVGRSFGRDRNQEVSLRFQHISNAGIKKPNPGEDFVLLRYAVRF
jgi:lipid A 3-O-deacylase